MKIKFVINFPGLGSRKKLDSLTEKKPAARRTSFWKKISAYSDVFKLLFAVGLAYAIGFRFEATQWEIMTLGYFLFALLRKFDSRLSAGLALAFLALTPVFLYAVDEEIAETLAVYAFYFLCITVVQEIGELWSGTWAGWWKKIRAVKKGTDLSPVSRRATAFGAALRQDLFGSARAIGQYWIVFLMLLSVYAAMIFFFKFETNRLAFYALAGLSVVSVLARLWQWGKGKPTA